MKLLRTTALALVIAGPALAGGLAEPVMEPTVAPAVIAEDTAAGSRAGILVPIFALLLFAIAASSGGDGVPVVENGPV